jgi:hypothetical protein
MRNGPISQSLGIARTRKKTTTRPAKKRRKPNFRRRRRSFLVVESGPAATGATATTETGALYGTSATIGSGSALTGATAGTGSGVTTGGVSDVPGWVPAATPVSSCSFARAGLIGAGTAGITGAASGTGGVVSLLSRS